ncbi:MAG: type transport system permease protein [Chloroflexota bacterium]|nr:type transport system permease protein [Chloroflexota bacterium]
MGITPESRILLGKELRQIRRSRRAVLTSTLLPLLLLVIMPMGQLASFRSMPAEALQRGGTQGLPPGIDPTNPVSFYTYFLFPLFLVIGGLMVPSQLATHTVVVERERRSLELLMALPVRVSDIVVGKLLAILAVAVGITLPLFAVDCVFMVVWEVVTPLYLALAFLVLLSSLACAIAMAFVISLIARDFRTANNISGLIVVPIIFVTLALMGLVPGDVKLVVLAAALLATGLAGLLAGLRWITFERYLS